MSYEKLTLDKSVFYDFLEICSKRNMNPREVLENLMLSYINNLKVVGSKI